MDRLRSRRRHGVITAAALAAGLVVGSAPTAAAGSITTVAGGCAPSTVVPGASSSPWPFFVDGFETGTFERWTSAVAEGDARLSIGIADAHTGVCAGRFQITTSWTSRANVTRALPAGISAAWSDGWFRVDGEGVWGSNVGFFRFFDGSTRIADIFRQNGSGAIWIRTTDSAGRLVFRSLGVSIALRTWVHVRFRVVAAGASSTIEAWIDGTRRFAGPLWLGTSRLTTLLLGSEHVRQAMDLRFDDILLGVG